MNKRTRHCFRIPEASVERAAAIAESAYGVGPGVVASTARTGAPRRKESMEAGARAYFRAILGAAYGVNAVHRTLGVNIRITEAAVRRFGGPAVLASDVADVSAAGAPPMRIDAAWSPSRTSGVTGLFEKEAAPILGMPPYHVRELSARAAAKLRRMIGFRCRGVDRDSLGAGLLRSMTYRALAIHILDIADASGAEPMDVARAFVARVKGGAK